MDHKKDSHNRNLFHALGGFSKNMVMNHHRENLSEFVLHDLCSTELFNIKKAAYLVNNPDFTCMKGVTGYYQPEAYSKSISWHEPHEFTKHMQQADFNQNVRSLYNCGVEMKMNGTESSQIEQLAQKLQIKDPYYHIWSLKHDNQGLLIFEKPENNLLVADLPHFLPMFAFCSVF